MKQHSNMYFDLSHYALLKVTGSDAFDFLQKQFSGDLELIDIYGWLFSAWCLPNGRVVTTFIIFRHDDSLFLILPGMMKTKIIRRLSMFILHSNVKINDISDEYALFGIAGDDTDIRTLHSRSKIVLRLWDKVPRYVLIGKMDETADILNIICDTYKEGDRGNWSLLDIEAGIPWIVDSTSENYLPQMLNLDLMQGLSYKKGCYPGQEVIARLHYRGQLKKRMYLGSVDTVITPGPGDQIELADTGATVGDVIDAERHPDGGVRFLAVSESEHADKTTLRLRDTGSAIIKLAPINYYLSENS